MWNMEMNRQSENIVYAGKNTELEWLVKRNSIDLNFRRIETYDELADYLRGKTKLFNYCISSGLGVGRCDIEKMVYPSLILVDFYLPVEGREETEAGWIVEDGNKHLVFTEFYIFLSDEFDSREYEIRRTCENRKIPVMGEKEIISKLNEIE